MLTIALIRALVTFCDVTLPILFALLLIEKFFVHSCRKNIAPSHQIMERLTATRRTADGDQAPAKKGKSIFGNKLAMIAVVATIAVAGLGCLWWVMHKRHQAEDEQRRRRLELRTMSIPQLPSNIGFPNGQAPVPPSFTSPSPSPSLIAATVVGTPVVQAPERQPASVLPHVSTIAELVQKSRRVSLQCSSLGRIYEKTRSLLPIIANRFGDAGFKVDTSFPPSQPLVDTEAISIPHGALHDALHDLILAIPFANSSALVIPAESPLIERVIEPTHNPPIAASIPPVIPPVIVADPPVIPPIMVADPPVIPPSTISRSSVIVSDPPIDLAAALEITQAVAQVASEAKVKRPARKRKGVDL